MERVTVTVPDGLKSGEEFTVSFNGTEYTTEVPGGVQGGEDIDVELPAAPKSNKSQSVVVTVPGGDVPERHEPVFDVPDDALV